MYPKSPNILKLFLIPFGAWVLVHLVAVFGIFVAAIYPIWWLLSTTKLAPCLYCYFKTDKDYFTCPVCRRRYENGQLIYRNPWVSISRNLLLIMVFTLISISLVYVEARLLFCLGFPPTAKTVSFVIPSQSQYRLGEIFPMKIEIVGIKTPINVVQTDLSFNPDKVRIVDISTRDSFANTFIQKEINNDIGYARLTGGLPNPGFYSSHGFFGTVYFQGQSPGLVKIDFLPISMVLANDGRGTNVLAEIESASYLITPERIDKQEEELQKGLIPDSQILGTEDDITQLKFYQEEQILGTRSGEQIDELKKFNLLNFLSNILEAIDRFTLDLWGSVFSIKR